MKHYVVVSDADERIKLKVKTKAVAPGQSGAFVCAWCTKGKTKPFIDIVQTGFVHDYYRTLCLCQGCGKVTCLQYYMEPSYGIDPTETPVPVTRG